MAATKPLIKECLWLLNNFGVTLTKRTFCDKAKTTIGLLIFQILLVEILLRIILNWKGVESMFDLTMFAVGCQILAKLYFVARSQRKLVKMLGIIDRFWQVKQGHDHIDAIYRFIKQIFVVALSFHIACLVICLVLFILFHRVPLAMYYPSRPTETPRYQLIMLFQISMCISCESGYAGFEFLFFTFITYIYCEFKLIKERIYALANKLEIHGDEKRLLQELALIIDQQNLVFEFIETFKEGYSFAIMLVFFSSIFIVSASLASMVIKGFGDIPSLLVLILFSSFFLALLFVYCLAGNVLMISSEEVLNVIEESNLWLVEDIKFKKALILVVLRSQKVASIKAGGVFDLNLETFTTVVNYAFSFFSLFKATYGKSERI